jgi:hypothetical protein
MEQMVVSMYVPTYLFGYTLLDPQSIENALPSLAKALKLREDPILLKLNMESAEPTRCVSRRESDEPT